MVWSFVEQDTAMMSTLEEQTVNTVRCEASDILQSGLSDMACIHIRFENGLHGQGLCLWLHPFKEKNFVVIGDKGMVVFDDTVE